MFCEYDVLTFCLYLGLSRLTPMAQGHPWGEERGGRDEASAPNGLRFFFIQKKSIILDLNSVWPGKIQWFVYTKVDIDWMNERLQLMFCKYMFYWTLLKLFTYEWCQCILLQQWSVFWGQKFCQLGPSLIFKIRVLFSTCLAYLTNVCLLIQKRE